MNRDLHKDLNTDLDRGLDRDLNKDMKCCYFSNQVLLIFISKRVCVNVLSLYSGFEEGFAWGFA